MNCYGCIKPCPDSFDNYGCKNKVLKSNEGTLDRDKSEELFNEIQYIALLVQKLGGCVQNPDFVNEENAQENYQMFYNNYRKITDRLVQLREDIFNLHDKIISK